MNILEYVRPDGTSPFKNWFHLLDPIAAAKVSVAIVRMELGNTSNIKWFAGIGEYRINWGPGYRIYLAMDGQHVIILFGGGTKKSQASDIARAKLLYQEYTSRKQQ